MRPLIIRILTRMRMRLIGFNLVPPNVQSQLPVLLLNASSLVWCWTQRLDGSVCTCPLLPPMAAPCATATTLWTRWQQQCTCTDRLSRDSLSCSSYAVIHTRAVLCGCSTIPASARVCSARECTSSSTYMILSNTIPLISITDTRVRGPRRCSGQRLRWVATSASGRPWVLSSVTAHDLLCSTPRLCSGRMARCRPQSRFLHCEW